MKPYQLLIDADMLVYRFAYSNERAVRWDHDTWSYIGDLDAAIAGFSTFLDNIHEHLQPESTVLVLSDSESNWRRDVYPQYKGQRAGWLTKRVGLAPPKPGPRRPMLWKPLRDWLVEEWNAIVEPGLEGDDLLGMLATNPSQKRRYQNVIVSDDKDMKTVPALHFSIDSPIDGLVKVDKKQAALYHMTQTLTGDQTDNYPGCPGIGPARAQKILAPFTDDAYAPECWRAIVDTYESKRLGEPLALVNAQVSRVLHHGEYNPKTGEIQLWQPRKV